MLDGRVLEHGKAHRDTDAVVGTQGGAVRRHPFTVHIGVDRVLQEVMGRVGRLLRDHVHMALEDDTAPVLEARGGRSAEDDVAGLVLEDLHVVFLAPVQQIFDDLPFMLGRARNLGQTIEITPNYLGFQIFDAHIINVLVCYLRGYRLSRPS